MLLGRAAARWARRPAAAPRLIGAAAPAGARRRRAAAAAPAAAADPGAPGDPPARALRLLALSRGGTAALAAYLAGVLRPGDAYLLSGDVGAGKSAFARAFVRAALRDADAAVPSPTYVLRAAYEPPAAASELAGGAQRGGAAAAPAPRQPPHIHHYDLYRLEGGAAAGALARLDLPASWASAVTLVEWPQRLAGGAAAAAGAAPPAAHLALRIAAVGDAERGAAEAEARRGGGWPWGGAAPAADGDEVEDDDAAADDDEDAGGDRRWRRIDVEARGEGWAARLAPLEAALRARARGRTVLGAWPLDALLADGGDEAG